MLKSPNPNRPFNLFPDACSKYTLGAILIQDGKVVSTFSWKFNDAQLKYTVTGQELSACVKAYTHFGQIIHGCNIRIWTNHQNLTHDDTQHVNFWEQQSQIFLDAELAPTFQHIAGKDNTGTGADGIRWLPMTDETSFEVANSIFAISTVDRDNNPEFPLDMRQICLAQAKN